MEPLQPWAPPSLFVPLGADEFGRHLLVTLASATVWSTLKGAVLASLVLTVAFLLAEALSLGRTPATRTVLRVVVGAVESVPAVLWVLAVLVSVREPRLLVVSAAFALVSLPAATAVIAGELDRLRAMPYAEAAYALGLREREVVMRHLLPNAWAVLGPSFRQIAGAAVAVDGAVGVLGLGNRTDLDLGVFLLRGLESFVTHPHLLAVTLVAYLAVYAVFFGSVHRDR